MPKIVYKNALGEKLKSVTTIIGAQCHWGAQALYYWNWKEGAEGRGWRESLEAAANAGTLAHSMIESFLKDAVFPIPVGIYTDEQIANAAVAFDGFKHWFEGEGVEVVNTELSLVSEEYQYGGTIDCIAWIRGKLSILDWKTSSSVHPNYIVQLGGYRQVINEVINPESPVKDAYLFRMDKECAAWAYHYFPSEQLDLGWEAFKHFLALDKIEKKIKV